jgi:uncharacterized protein YabN with tetrapyrrole methylase and pyrophosphatase domain
MAKHFEFLWEEAEVIASRTIGEDVDIYADIKECLDKLEDADVGSTAIESLKLNKEEVFGDMLFRICLIAKRLNIDAYWTLRESIDNAKIDDFDPEITSE